MPAAAVVGGADGAAAYFVRSCLKNLHTELLMTTRALLHHWERSSFDAYAVSGSPHVRYTLLASPAEIVLDDEALCCLVHVVHAQLHQNMWEIQPAVETDLQ